MSEAPIHTLPPGGAAPSQVEWLRAADGVRLRAALWRADEPVAHAIKLTGRTEFLEKASVPIAELLARGYDVVSVDWRGQGLSDRAAQPASKGHIGDFSEFQRDLDTLLVWASTLGLRGPRLMLAHSMGGAITAAALQRSEIAGAVDAAVLCSPMFGIYMPTALRVATWMTVRIGMALGRGDRWPPSSRSEVPYVLSEPDWNLLTQDGPIWNWLGDTARAHPEMTLAMPTLGWLDASAREIERLAKCPRPSVPAMTVVGTDEKVVKLEAVRETAKRMGWTCHEIAEGRHELLVEQPDLRAQTWARIDAFLTEQGLPAGST